MALGILGWILVGLIAGAIGKAIMGDSMGIIPTLVVGIIGGLLGGWLGSVIFGKGTGGFFELSTWICAIAGTCILLGILGIFSRGSARAK
ncbi:GlsB/YeaQ/YmgE family stress response membrane protein [Pseudoglutamicibacter albus]|uniref:GlsB/YeaQ/YmgE family stress response membrane protein n=1 Tax=Pseudoglutamicibacter albus TaxID=98671 RepID=UPI0030B887F0